MLADISVRSTVRFWGFIGVKDWLAQISRNGNFSLPATRSLMDDPGTKIKRPRGSDSVKRHRNPGAATMEEISMVTSLVEIPRLHITFPIV